ncbi:MULTISPECIES: PLP-dependent aminotransferase family protein [Streptomyces]|uniref:MocR-like pyridoxine biosynthesis transcription factor PdxR n=1 Tax=Streptomyces TaxID=1883 RepID=UPI00093F67ED|nr:MULTISPECIES: PLP-dependent aminotransferase family protein [Streptomyces]MBX9423356.1 PLP-dependent aminotransferase family protein [Streptomyces lateritius]OKJ68000.1 GntR family transcriptional regulator [Streptomyces sp. CB02261]
MANEWATFGADLHLELRGPRLRAGLMDALREAVRSGRLAAGTRLPSSRSLAADLGMARNTVADAYAELVAEGWLTARQGSGTRVAARAEPRPPARPSPASSPALSLPRPAPPTHNLKAGTPDLASFPRAEWLTAYRRALTAAPNEAFGYGDPRGRIELRGALADYLARARGVHARPERIVVCAGFVHGLMLIGQVLRNRGVREVAVESYGLGLHTGLLTGAGLGTPVLPYDERGTRVEELSWPGPVGAVLMTAAHQFPLGGALPPDRRSAVVDWARASGGFVLEDDYDGEFRYDRQPVGALQGLDPERVVYFGTASKSLAPGLRLAWMVLPESLAGEVAATKGAVDWSSGAPDQLAFAEFLRSGAYDRHVRAMRLRYRRRRDQLVTAVAAHSPDTRVSGIAAGLHAVLALPPGTEQAVLRSAAWHGLAVQGVNQFRRPTVPATLDGLVVGYATPTDSAWQGALRSLCRVLP